jgi:hypothetical protein
VASVLPLISMVRSQEVASALAPAALDRWHQHGKMFMMLKISPFGEVPMTPGAQQKLLVWLKPLLSAHTGQPVLSMKTSFSRDSLMLFCRLPSSPGKRLSNHPYLSNR